jgi:hypothetical protein
MKNPKLENQKNKCPVGVNLVFTLPRTSNFIPNMKNPKLENHQNKCPVGARRPCPKVHFMVKTHALPLRTIAHMLDTIGRVEK